MKFFSLLYSCVSAFTCVCVLVRDEQKRWHGSYLARWIRRNFYIVFFIRFAFSICRILDNTQIILTLSEGDVAEYVVAT